VPPIIQVHQASDQLPAPASRRPTSGDHEPLQPPVQTPVVVVSPQFCAPDVVPLTVTKKVASLSGGDFTVTDPSGAVVLQFKGSVWSVRNRRVLLDAARQPILTMHEKVSTPTRPRSIGHPFQQQ